MRDVVLEAMPLNLPPGVNGLPDYATFTVIWVDQPTVKFVGQVSADNSAKDAYKAWTTDDSYNLGGPKLFAEPNTGAFHMQWAFEVKAIVHPSNFAYPGSDVWLDRDAYARFWKNNGELFVNAPNKNFSLLIPPGNDSSELQFLDLNPVDSNPQGTIYDIDAPGMELVQAPLGEIRRMRANFRQFANVKAQGLQVRASMTTNLFVVFSMTQLLDPAGDLFRIINPPDVAGDNQAGLGSKPVSWNLQ